MTSIGPAPIALVPIALAPVGLTTIGPAWALTVLLAYLPVPAAMRRRDRASPRRLALMSGLFLYAAAVIAVTIFPIRVRPGAGHWAARHWWLVIQWIPLHVPPISFVLNVIMFVPLGLLLPLLWPRTDSVRRLAAWALALSCVIEGTQFVLWVTLGNVRTVDVNDLIANIAGAVLGLLLLRRARADQEAAQARM